MAILLAALTKTIALFVWCVIIKTKFATTLDIDCPQMCDCQQFSGNNTLRVDCGEYGFNESVLAQELDFLLSNDKLRENLIMLSITNTMLTQVPMPVCQMRNLHWLLLDGNRFDRLPDNCFTNMTSLIWLSASKNNITELQDGLFDGLNSLEILDFSYNMIASIGLHVFSNPNDLVKLNLVSLGYNRLRSLEPWHEVYTDQELQKFGFLYRRTLFRSSQTVSNGNSIVASQAMPKSISLTTALGT